ncbi:MAG: hypothetical protein AAFR03_00460 [Pseudomonadota bacterium]
MTSNDEDQTPELAGAPKPTGQSTPVEIKAAWIGAAAAIMAALIAFMPKLLSGSSDKNLELTLSVSRDHAQYTDRRMKSSELPFRVKGQTEFRAFYLAPSVDIGLVLSIISLGTETDDELFPTSADVIPDETDPSYDRSSLIWSVIEHAGSLYLAIEEEAPQRLSAFDNDPATVGIAVLRRVYLDQFDPDSQDHWRRFAARAVAGLSAENDLDQAALILSNRFLSPVLDLTITNPTDDPVVVTGLSIEVDQVAPAYSGLKSGLLNASDRVIFDLTSNTKRVQKPLVSPLQIASNESARIEVQLNSDEMFSYLLKLKLIKGAEQIDETEWIVVDFGFQPPDSLVQ